MRVATFWLTVLLGTHTLTADASYQITDIPTPPDALWLGPPGTIPSPGLESYPKINASHQVAITFQTPAGNYKPYLWSNGIFTSLNFSNGALIGGATAINDAGNVVGFQQSTFAGFAQPIVWIDGAPTNLDQADQPYGIPWSINNNGEIVGSVSKYFGQLGFNGGSLPSSTAAYWNSTGTGSFQNYDPDQSLPVAINNNGQFIVNTFTRATVTSNVYLVDHGNTIPLSYSGMSLYATDLNDLGEIIGRGDVNFLWQNGAFTLLQQPGNNGNAIPFAINNSGVIVGQAMDQDGEPYAVLWDENQLQDLNSYLPTESGWHLQLASDITDDGTILGLGTYQGEWKAFILNPTGDISPAASSIPEPATLPLLALAALPLLRRRLKL